MFYNDFNTDTYQDKTSDGGYGAWDLASDEYACSQSGWLSARYMPYAAHIPTFLSNGKKEPFSARFTT
jgi:hypothetical protein